MNIAAALLRALVLVLAFAFFLLPRVGDDRHPPRTSVRSALDELGRRLREAQPGSEEARALSRDIQRARRKAVHTEPAAENPGAFLEALAELKTGPNGERYRPGYREAALEQAVRAKGASRAPLPWVERGPGNVAGRARALVVDAADASGDTWLAANVGGGVWRTTNAGQSWEDLTPALTTLSATCLAQCLSQPAVLYLGTGMGYGRIVDLEGSGIWKSLDGGDSWQQLASTAEGQLFDAINRIVVDPDDPDVVVVCGNNQFSHLAPNGGSRESGIFRSEDGGASWTQTFFPDAVLGTSTDNRVQQIVANPRNFQTLYATVNEVGVVKSVDGGRSWAVSADDFALPSDIGNPPGGGYGLAGVSVRTEMAIAPTDTARLYAAVERPRGTGDIYMSTDAGSSWALVADQSGDPNWFNAFGSSGSSGAYTAGWFDNTIAVHPYDADVIFVGGVNLYRMDISPGIPPARSSSPIGWWIPNALGIPVVHADHHFLVAIEDDPGAGAFRLIDANDGGVGYSVDGGVNWVQLTGLGTTQFYGADKQPGADVYIGGMQDNGTWHSGLDPGPGSAWSFDLGGDGFEVAWHALDAGLVLGGSQFGNLSRSTDGGLTWTPIPDARAGNAPFISKIANVDTDPDLVFTVGDQGVKRSDDFGASWTLTSLPGPWLGYRPFDNAEVSLAEPQHLWVSSKVTVDPASGRRGGIYVSTDGGLSFTQVDGSLPSAVVEASGIATHPLEPETAYLLFAAPGVPKILRTTDLGQTWEDLSGFAATPKGLGNVSVRGFPDVAVFSLLVMPFDPDRIWAGTEIGLFESLDGGQTWSFSDGGLPPVAVFELRVAEDEVVAATQGRGIWSVALPELAVWEAPVVTLVPRLRPPVMLPIGELGIQVVRPSPYDSTQVFVDGSLWRTEPANAAADELLLTRPVLSAATVNAAVVAWKDGRAYRTPVRSGQAYPAQVEDGYVSDFEDPLEAQRWTTSGFSVRSQTAFDSRALHSTHRYPVQTDLVAQLRVPIRVATSSARLRYRDVALVEPGVPGVTDWRNANFFDYVVVEGSRNGLEWLALGPGYDSRADALWLSVYNQFLDPQTGDSTANGAEALYRERSLDLLDTFAPGELIFVRFRLHSDPGAVGWGWALDDLRIQPRSVGILDGDDPPTSERPAVTRLHANRPNPFNPSTVIRWTMARPGPASLIVYDLRGRRVRTLVDSREERAGDHEIGWDGRDDGGRPAASGTYLYRLRTAERDLSRKMVLLQ